MVAVGVGRHDTVDPRDPLPPEVGRDDPSAHVQDFWVHGRDGDGNAALVVRSEGRWAVLRLDPRTKDIDVLAHDRPTMPWVHALMDDGSAIALEDQERLVRYGPSEGDRLVLFPR